MVDASIHQVLMLDSSTIATSELPLNPTDVIPLQSFWRQRHVRAYRMATAKAVALRGHISAEHLLQHSTFNAQH